MAPQVHSFDFPMCLDEVCIKMRFLQENCQNSFSVGQKYNLHYIKNSCLELFLQNKFGNWKYFKLLLPFTNLL